MVRRDNPAGPGGPRRERRSSVEKPDDGMRVLPLPWATSRSAANNLNECLNPGLIFDKYIRFDHDAQGWIFKEGTKLFNVGEVIRAQERCKGSDKWKSMFNAFVARWTEMVEKRNGKPFRLTPQWRFVTGLGENTPLEVGFRFHSLYGFPVIPGSGLKGLARAVALRDIAVKLHVPLLLAGAKAKANKSSPTPMEKLERLLLADDKRADAKGQPEREKAVAAALRSLKEDVPAVRLESAMEELGLFRLVFGTTHAAGQAIFYDAVPEEPPTLEVDIMNVHYGDYYQDSEGLIAPADYLSPTPIPFLTVGQSPFLFAVGWKGKHDPKAHQQAIDWLKRGLTSFGAGAKTAAGYGYFVSPEPKGASNGARKSTAVAREAEEQGQRTGPAPALSEAPKSAALPERRGTVREYDPRRGSGRLTDAETGTEMAFYRQAILDKGWSPGRRNEVLYTAEEKDGKWTVVSVRKGK